MDLKNSPTFKFREPLISENSFRWTFQKGSSVTLIKTICIEFHYISRILTSLWEALNIPNSYRACCLRRRCPGCGAARVSRELLFPVSPIANRVCKRRGSFMRRRASGWGGYWSAKRVRRCIALTRSLTLVSRPTNFYPSIHKRRGRPGEVHSHPCVCRDTHSSFTFLGRHKMSLLDTRFFPHVTFPTLVNIIWQTFLALKNKKNNRFLNICFSIVG